MLARLTLALCTLALVAGGAPAQQPAPAAPVAGQVPAGFQLGPQEAAYLDQVLAQWEQQSGQIETFSCDFTQLVYDQVFGPGKDANGQPIAKTEGYGTVSYQKPDKGSFQVKELLAWDAQQNKRVANPNLVGEHWVCDGENVYEYKHEQKQLVVRPIPPHMQGKNIADGPLPFLFGAEAEKLKARYWLRVDPRAPEGSIWLAAMPKRQEDAANYRMVELMLDAERMLPNAMRVTNPDNSQTTYTFKLAEASINSRMTQLWNTVFQAPKTPWGWKRIVEEPQTAAAPSQRR